MSQLYNQNWVTKPLRYGFLKSLLINNCATMERDKLHFGWQQV